MKIFLLKRYRQGNKTHFITIFPTYKDLHFYKDPGQLPYRLSKLGYCAKIVSYKNVNHYPITEKFIPVKTIPNNRYARKFSIGMILFLIFNSKKIDVLNLFHFKWTSLLFAYWYKTLNPNGFVYLKMDNCHYSGTYPWEKIFDPDKKPMSIFKLTNSNKERRRNYLSKKYFVNKVDLWSVEDEASREYYESEYSLFRDKLITVYNGHAIDINERVRVKSFSEKENIILSVGRFGTFQKATEILLKAFRGITENCDWNLHLAGTIDPEFLEYWGNYLEQNPDLENRIIYHGSLEKDKLFELYNLSKIFCLPSRFEGFAIVYSEAMYFGNAIITTPYSSLRDLIEDNELGLLVENDDVKGLAEAMLRLIKNQKLTEKYFNNARRFAKENLSWDKIVFKIDNEINKRIK